MKRIVVLFLCTALLAAPALGQGPAAVGSPAPVEYGKWGLLAGSIAMNLLGLRAHNRAEDAFNAVAEACAADRTRCATLSNGAYADPFLESQFKKSLDYDSAARKWLIGGETALVGSAVMFIWELTRAKSRRENIPFEPEVTQRDGVTNMGFRVSF